MKPAKAFMAAFILTLCALALPLSFLVIEYNMRHTVYGRVETGVSFSVDVGRPVLTDDNGEAVIAIPKQTRRAAYALLSAPARLIGYFLRGETQAATRLWEYIWPPAD